MKKTLNTAKPIIDCFGKQVGLMGPSGAGQLTKMVNQICIAGVVQGLAEAIHFGKKAGLDIDKSNFCCFKRCRTILANG